MILGSLESWIVKIISGIFFQVPEVHRAADPQATLPASCSRDCPGLQD